MALFMDMTSGFSAKMTLTAGLVLGVAYGGKIATGSVPSGTKASAVTPLGVLTLGGAPPPGVPGLGLPGGTPCALTMGIVGMNANPPATTAVATGAASLAAW